MESDFHPEIELDKLKRKYQDLGKFLIEEKSISFEEWKEENRIRNNSIRKQILKLKNQPSTLDLEHDKSTLLINGFISKLVTINKENYNEYVKSKENEMKDQMEEISNIKIEIEKLTPEVDKIRLKRKQSEMIDEYVAYAINNEIVYDKDDSFDIFRQCNKFHQNALRCKLIKQCKNSSQSKSTRCICGDCENRIWDEYNLDYTNLLDFNVSDLKPYGNNKQRPKEVAE